MKVCTKCGELKPLEDFYTHIYAKDGRSSQCKSCIRDYHKVHREEDRQRTQHYRQQKGNKHLEHRYGITHKEYEQLLKNQNNVCAICKQPAVNRKLDVDHNHETGVIRGLLCIKCNTALGLLNHNIQLLQGAIQYLETEPREINLLGLFSQLGVRIG